MFAEFSGDKKGRKAMDKRQMSRTKRFILGALLAGVWAALIPVLSVGGQDDQPAKAQKTEVFPRPKGPYAVGTHEYLWVDQKREEPFTKDPADRRHLLARVWYPADPVTGKDTAFYV